MPRRHRYLGKEGGIGVRINISNMTKHTKHFLKH